MSLSISRQMRLGIGSGPRLSTIVDSIYLPGTAGNDLLVQGRGVTDPDARYDVEWQIDNQELVTTFSPVIYHNGTGALTRLFVYCTDSIVRLFFSTDGVIFSGIGNPLDGRAFRVEVDFDSATQTTARLYESPRTTDFDSATWTLIGTETTPNANDGPAAPSSNLVVSGPTSIAYLKGNVRRIRCSSVGGLDVDIFPAQDTPIPPTWASSAGHNITLRTA